MNVFIAPQTCVVCGSPFKATLIKPFCSEECRKSYQKDWKEKNKNYTVRVMEKRTEWRKAER